MFRKGIPIIIGTIIWGYSAYLLQGVNGRSSYDLAPIFREINTPVESERSPAPPTSTINESQQTTGSVSGFVNSTAQGNGQPNSAVAYAWQGGQTSASSTQTATADNSNSTAQTTGFSTCQQGYLGTAGGANATAANSIGNALCNATYTEDGTHNVNNSNGEKKFPGRKGKPPMPAKPPQYSSQGFNVPAPGPPQMITMNYTVGQTGEAQSGQTHNSISNAGGLLSILAGGFANIPQGSMTFQSSAFDNLGQPVLAEQDLLTDQGLASEEQTLIAVSGNQVGHNSGGLSHVYGLGNMQNTSYNSHAPEEEEVSGGWRAIKL